MISPQRLVCFSFRHLVPVSVTIPNNIDKYLKKPRQKIFSRTTLQISYLHKPSLVENVSFHENQKPSTCNISAITCLFSVLKFVLESPHDAFQCHQVLQKSNFQHFVSKFFTFHKLSLVENVSFNFNHEI